MLVLHQLPGSDPLRKQDSGGVHGGGDASEPHGSTGDATVGSLAWAAAAGSPAALAERVAALARNASAPRVLLLARTPHLGRWEDKLLNAADVAVLPYLGGTAGKELTRAASCGRPVVTTAGGPAADVAGHDTLLVQAKLLRCPLAAAAHGAGAPTAPLGCLQVNLHVPTQFL